jgi:hypothetical protein
MYPIYASYPDYFILYDFTALLIYLMKSTICEAPHYTAFCIMLLLPLLYFQIFSSVPSGREADHSLPASAEVKKM